MSPGCDRPLYILAFDHRTSFERKLYGIDGTPTPDDRRRLAEGKRIILDGLLAAADAAPPGTVGEGSMHIRSRHVCVAQGIVPAAIEELGARTLARLEEEGREADG